MWKSIRIFGEKGGRGGEMGGEMELDGIWEEIGQNEGGMMS